MEDMIEAAEHLDAARDLFDTIINLDLTVPRSRLRRAVKKLERYFGG